MSDLALAPRIDNGASVQVLWFVLLDAHNSTPLMDNEGNVHVFHGWEAAVEAVEKYGRGWVPVPLAVQETDDDSDRRTE